MKSFVALLAIGVVVLAAVFVLVRVARLLRRLWRRSSGPPTHEELLDAAEDIASASRVAAVIATFAAAVAAPAGLLAILAMVGLVSVPLIVTLAPILVMVAAAAAALYAVAKLYAKHKRR